MSVTFPARVMPDGTICRSGPDCRRHGGKQEDSFATDLKKQMEELDTVLKVTDSVSEAEKFLPKGAKRKGLNSSDPDWADELYQMSREAEDNAEYGYAHVLSSYRISGSRYLNSYLRGGREKLKQQILRDTYSTEVTEEDLDYQQERMKSTVEQLDKCFNHEVTFREPKLLYRGVSIHEPIPADTSAFEYVKQKYSIGSVIEEKAYSSTSADPDYMTFFGRKVVKKKHGPHMVYEIVAKKGLPIMDETRNNSTRPRDGDILTFEREVLLNRGAKYRVIGVKNITFEHSYPEGLMGWHASGSALPKKVQFPVVQLEQIV